MDSLNRILPFIATLGVLCTPLAGQSSPPPKIYNTAKLKLMQGKPLIGGTVTSPDPNIYCAMANSRFDYTWIEMQHSPLTYEARANMIYAYLGTPAVPSLSLP